MSLESKICKETAVDTGANIAYSWLAGAIIGYLSGANTQEVVADRLSSTWINGATGSFYMKQRDAIFEKWDIKEGDNFFKRLPAEIESFAKIQIPVYFISRTIGNYLADVDWGKVVDSMNYCIDKYHALTNAFESIVSQAHLDIEKVIAGSATLFIFSTPIIATMGPFQDYARRLFGLKPSSDKAQHL